LCQTRDIISAPFSFGNTEEIFFLNPHPSGERHWCSLGPGGANCRPRQLHKRSPRIPAFAGACPPGGYLLASGEGEFTLCPATLPLSGKISGFSFFIPLLPVNVFSVLSRPGRTTRRG
jgi:hypothetical protein